MSEVIELSKALLTPLIAIVAVYIAWQQWKTNKLRLRLERYERRLRVYEELKRILSLIIRDADISTDELLKFRSSVAEADFLFGPEVLRYIDEIYSRGLKLWLANQQYRDYTKEVPEDYNHQKVVNEKHNQLMWLSEQLEPAKEKFKKYLDISK